MRLQWSGFSDDEDSDGSDDCAAIARAEISMLRVTFLKSLYVQLAGVLIVCLLLNFLATTALTRWSDSAHLSARIGWVMLLTCAACLAIGSLWVRQALRCGRVSHERTQAVLSARTHTVDRLLDFSQTLQGAGQSEQVYAGLGHVLQTELGLAGLIILAHDAEALPPTTVKMHWPEGLLKSANSIGDMGAALCPCLRQNLPRNFKPDGSPVRCAIDQSLTLGPNHPAYCIPFNVGRKIQVLVHMLLPEGAVWTEDLRQLAHAYVNTGYSALMSLHHLAEAEKQSMTDGLTGLYNRRSMEQLMAREVALAERHGHSLSLVMIDMDLFKEVNDAHGHAAGDHMLRAFADCVRMTLRKTDLAFRYGGDEFIIALPQTPLAQAQQVVNKLRQAFQSVDFSSAIANLEHQPTLSIGVTERSAASNVLSFQQLLTAADAALYSAKSDNRNCVKIFQPPHAA